MRKRKVTSKRNGYIYLVRRQMSTWYRRMKMTATMRRRYTRSESRWVSGLAQSKRLLSFVVLEGLGARETKKRKNDPRGHGHMSVSVLLYRYTVARMRRRDVCVEAMSTKARRLASSCVVPGRVVVLAQKRD